MIDWEERYNDLLIDKVKAQAEYEELITVKDNEIRRLHKLFIEQAEKPRKQYSYVYIRSEPQLWTVGFYNPDGEWMTDSDHEYKEEAAKRVAWLNGSML